MKIGLVSPYDYSHPGGVTEHIRFLRAELGRLGHDVMVFAPAGLPELLDGDPGFVSIGRPIKVPVNDSVARVSISFQHRRRLARLLHEQRFDVLHFHEPLMPTVSLSLLHSSETANVGTFHAYAKKHLGYYMGRPVLRPYFNRLHRVIAVSPAARDFISRYFPAEFTIIPNGIDPTRFGPDFPPIRHLKDGRINVMCLGRLEPRKGVLELVRAYAIARRRDPRLRLVVVGNGPMRSAIESVVHSQQIPDVVMAGHVPDAVKPRYLATADIFCAPATGGESFGIVLLEAMATRLPVIASGIPGYLSVLTPEQDSLIVPPADPEALAAAILRLSGDAALRERLAEASLRRSRDFTWERVTRRIVSVYEEARNLVRSARPDPAEEVTLSGVHG